MPKLKTKSGAKKRFSYTAKNKIKSTQAGKQHFMRKRSKRSLRNLRGTTILSDVATKIVAMMMPYKKKNKVKA